MANSQHHSQKQLISHYRRARPLTSLGAMSLDHFNATMITRKIDLFSFKNCLDRAKRLITPSQQARCYSQNYTSGEIKAVRSEHIVGHKIKVTLDNFGTLVKEKCVLVDKTMMIKTFLEGEEVCLITRPRRFGKSLNISMLQHFFAPTIDGLPTVGLFDQFNIAQVDNGEFLKTHQGQYPVISITFKDVQERSYADTNR
jgi:hypothetical protein